MTEQQPPQWQVFDVTGGKLARDDKDRYEAVLQLDGGLVMRLTFSWFLIGFQWHPAAPDFNPTAAKE